MLKIQRSVLEENVIIMSVQIYESLLMSREDISLNEVVDVSGVSEVL